MSKWKEESILRSLTSDHIPPREGPARDRCELVAVSHGDSTDVQGHRSRRSGGHGDLSKGASCWRSCVFRETVRNHHSRATLLHCCFSSVVSFLAAWSTSCVQNAALRGRARRSLCFKLGSGVTSKVTDRSGDSRVDPVSGHTQLALGQVLWLATPLANLCL